MYIVEKHQKMVSYIIVMETNKQTKPTTNKAHYTRYTQTYDNIHMYQASED
jgi:hypothetical protein